MSLSGSPEEWVQIYSIGPGGMVGVEGVNLQQHMPYRARAIGPLSLLAMPFCNYVEMFEKKQGLPLKVSTSAHTVWCRDSPSMNAGCVHQAL